MVRTKQVVRWRSEVRNPVARFEGNPRQEKRNRYLTVPSVTGGIPKRTILGYTFLIDMPTEERALLSVLTITIVDRQIYDGIKNLRIANPVFRR